MKFSRLLLKAASWRLVAVAVTSGVAYGVTGDVSTAAVVGGIDAAIKTALYMVHDWAWSRVGD